LEVSEVEDNKIQLFEDKRIRTAWDGENEEWLFPIADVVGILCGSLLAQDGRTLKAEGNQTVTICHTLKMTAADGKKSD
jgi:hypothetical protein